MGLERSEHFGDGQPGAVAGRPKTLRRQVAAALICAALLVALGVVVNTGATLSFDVGFDAALAPLRTPASLAFFGWITTAGTEPSRYAIICATGALLWSEARMAVLSRFVTTVVGSEATTWVVKYLVDRPRPTFLPDVASASSPSFPSAHAAGSLALVGALAIIVAGRLDGRSQRVVVGLVAAVLVALVGFSRLLLNVHFPTDVAGGFLVGGFWVLVGFSRPVPAECRDKGRAPAAPS